MNQRLAPLLLATATAATTGCNTTSIVDQPWDGAVPNGFTNLPITSGAFVGFVTNSYSDTISVVDLRSKTVIAERPVGRNPIDVDGPHHLAFDPVRGELFVALSYPAATTSTGLHAAHASSERPGYVQRLRLRDLAILDDRRVDPNPGDVVFDSVSRELVVSHFNLNTAFSPDAGESRGTLAWFALTASAADAPPVATKAPTCRAPHGLRPSADGTAFFVACYGDDTVAKVSTTTRQVLATWPVGAGGLPGRVTYGPYSVALSPDGSRLAVGCTESKDVRVLDATTGRLLATLPTDGAAFFPSWDAAGATLAVPVQGPDALLFFDETAPNTFTKSHTVRFDAACTKPHEIRAIDDATVAVVCEGDHVAPGAIAFVTTAGVGAIVPVGVYPDRLLAMVWP